MNIKLNPLSLKRVYLSKSPLWQLYRLNMRDQPIRALIDKQHPVFLINSKLFSAVIIEKYSKIQNLQRQSIANQISMFLQKKIEENSIRIDYNILRLFAFFGFQEKLKHYDSHQRLSFRLSIYQKDYLQKLSKVQSKSDSDSQQTRVVQFIQRYAQQVDNNSFDQLDDLIVANIPNSQGKMLKICRIRSFYWAQDSENISSILDFVYNQVMSFQWRKIETLSVVIARISSSKANDKYRMLEFLDELVNHQQRPFSSKHSFGRKDFLNQIQYQAFLWIAVLTLKNLVSQIKPSQSIENKVCTRSRGKFIRILKSLDVRQKNVLLEMIGLLSITKKAYRQMNVQASKTSSMGNSLKDLKIMSSSSQHDKQLEYFISKYESNIKNIVFNNRIKLVETLVQQETKVGVLFEQNFTIDSEFLNQIINSEFQKIFQNFLIYNERQRKTMLKLSCMVKDSKCLKQTIHKIQLSSVEKQLFKKNTKFAQQMLK